MLLSTGFLGVGCSEQGLLSSCAAWASRCGGFACDGAQALECGLSSGSTWALERRLSSSLLHIGLAAPPLVESSQARDRKPMSLPWLVYS